MNTYPNQSRTSEGSLLGFMFGLIVGSAVTALFTPRSGEDIRNVIMRNKERMKEAMKESAKDIKQTGSSAAEEMKQDINTATSNSNKNR